MRSIEQTMVEGFFLVGCTQAAAEVKDGIVIVQGQGFQETLQFLEALADLRRIRFVGFGIGLVELIENCFSIAVPGIKGMVTRVGFQCFGKGLQDNTSKKSLCDVTLQVWILQVISQKVFQIQTP